MLKPVHSRSLVDQVWSSLRQAIVLGQLRPGERITELEVAAQLNTSQGPVREALQRLEQEGLVTRVPHTGTFVSELSIDEMREIFAIRSTVEALAIRHTIRHMDEPKIATLEGLVEAMRQAAHAQNWLALVERDLEFHQWLVAWSGHPALLRVWTPLYAQVERFIILTHPNYFQNLDEIPAIHLPLIDSLRRDDANEAVQRIQNHVMTIWGRIEAGKNR